MASNNDRTACITIPIGRQLLRTNKLRSSRLNSIKDTFDPGKGGPALPDGAVGDYQMALVIDHGDVAGDSGFQETITYPAAFTLVSGFASETAAKDAAVAELEAEGMTTWVVAVDQDPASGLYTAFGAGLAPQD